MKNNEKSMNNEKYDLNVNEWNHLESKYILSKDRHLLDEKLRRMIMGIGNKNEIKLYTNKRIYVINIRVLDRDKKILAYSYIDYPKLLMPVFNTYIINRAENTNPIRKRLGVYFPIINKKVFDLDIPFSLHVTDDYNIYKILNYIQNQDLLSLYDTLNLIEYFTNNNTMAEIINNIFNRDSNLLKILLEEYYINHRKPEVKEDSIKEFFNKYITDKLSTLDFFDKTIFIVENLNDLITSVSNNGYIIGQGPQRDRGRINPRTSFLSLLDDDFRHCLMVNNYYHSGLHQYDNLSIEIPKQYFYFKHFYYALGGHKE